MHPTTLVELREDSDPRAVLKLIVIDLKFRKNRVRVTQQRDGHKVKGWKQQWKDNHNANIPGWDNWNFDWNVYNQRKIDVRCRHIALGILRGKRLDQIETLPTKPKKHYRPPDWKLISKYVGEGIYFYGMRKSAEIPKHPLALGTLTGKAKFELEGTLTGRSKGGDLRQLK